MSQTLSEDTLASARARRAASASLDEDLVFFAARVIRVAANQSTDMQ
jgi:hypothetical protein